MIKRDDNPKLTEWDFDIPRDNRFHDPLLAKNQQSEQCSGSPENSGQLAVERKQD